MKLDELKVQLLPSAKDIKLNLSQILTPEGAPDLNQNQIYAIALAAAYTTKDRHLIHSLIKEAKGHISTELSDAIKAAVTIMAMNNIYYRFIHLIKDPAFASLPAKLRMNVMANPGIEKVDFELLSLAVSAINGCGMCMESHTKELEKAGVSKLAIQSAIRIAAVINATATALFISIS